MLNKSQTLREELSYKYEYEKIIHKNNLVSKTDIEGNIIYVNDEFCEITGFSRDEILGQNHRIFKPKENISEKYKPLWNTISAGDTFKGIVRNITKDGKEIYLSTTISPVLNDKNEIVEYIAIRFNVSNEILLKKELELQNLKLKEAYKMARIGTWEFDITTNQTKLSKEVLTTLGLENHPINIDLDFIKDTIHEDNIKETIEFLQQVILNDSCEHRCIIRIVQTNGNNKWIDCQGRKIPNENKIIGTIQDITQRKEQDEELRKKERIISQQSKMATMGEMIENITHQWRQPLSTITVASTGMKMHKEIGTLSDDIFYSSVDGINESAKYLSKTIDDFRNFFKPNKTKINFDIKDTFDKTFKLINSQFKSNNIQIVLDVNSFMIFGQENELLQVLINILKNAKDELIKLDNKKLLFVEVLKYEDEVIIKIKDNAGGIPKNNISKIFDAYFTTKSDKEGGTGIGLYMSKNIIEKNLNGRIEVKTETYSYEDNTYKGAVFTIILPSC